MRIKHVINVRIFEDTDAKDGLWTPDKVLAEEVIDAMQRMTAGRFSIPVTNSSAADGTETEILSIGDMTAPARGVYVEADGDFQLVFGAAIGVWTPQAPSAPTALGWPIYVKLADTTTGRKARYFAEQDIASNGIQISNPSTSKVLTGRYVVYGDPLS